MASDPEKISPSSFANAPQTDQPVPQRAPRIELPNHLKPPAERIVRVPRKFDDIGR